MNSTSTKLILDGALFSECQIAGTNRHGMLRLAEDVTKELIEIKNLDVSFANTIYSLEYDNLLREFIRENLPSHKNQILSKKPFLYSSIPKLRGLLELFRNNVEMQVTINDLEKNDIFHSFYYPFPKSILKKNIKKSITFLDIISLRMDGYEEELINRTKKIIEHIVPNFAISISEFSKQDLLDYNREVEPERVFVAPLAASPTLFFPNKDKNNWELVKRKYSLPDNYFLSVSSKDLRKNTPHLIKSFAKFILQQKPNDSFLVLVGNFNFTHSMLNELEIDERVKKKIFISERYVENQDLASLYSNAICFFFMSLYEGFGLPPLEAMQCGIPVITSNTTSLPEVVGNAGIMLDPTDEDSLCEVMNTMYLDETKRENYSKLSLARASEFSWKRCAEEYANIFNKIKANF